MEYLARLRQFRQKMTLKTWNPHFKKFLKKNYATYGIVLYSDERPANSTHFDVSFIFLLQLGVEPEAAKVGFKRSLVSAKRLVRLTWNLYTICLNSWTYITKNFSTVALFLLCVLNIFSPTPSIFLSHFWKKSSRSKYKIHQRTF